MQRRQLLAGAAALLSVPNLASAEASDVRIARQPSIGHLPLMIMEERELLQKQAAARGLGRIGVDYVTLAGGAAMNDALLSNAIQFAAGGVPPMILLWSKTAGSSLEVKGMAAMNSMPLLMNTNNPAIKSLKDFKRTDKIALPAVKVSVQAVFLQMAAEKELGEDHRNDLDQLTVTLSHPDGMAALFAGQEITAHFTAAPIQELEARRPGIRTILNSFDILGMPSTFNVVWASSKFVNANPKISEAFMAALEEAIGIIQADKKAAAASYLRLAKDPSDAALIEQILNDPQVRFTTTPQAMAKYYEFMYRTRLISRSPKIWTDLFFPFLHAKDGN
ncbi:ABC transporter substrate-binding protein [Methylobacterium brachythecii]|uniref:NitT/TauT family transport system substrate-binding protein n=1 Tax=Methylobacterium brachythecii TaxID=1176177 RepID=A0A7W6F960_9HYPH|nr:ABC transporter substrate-binding protein [Methylobacterium brachythecii]MBB3904821.1 NitT/TauT family transport system substrate-binding protein [Methylobacterium brachythecii]GLS45373.1 nitrate ABC transporter substrate-binding protein [Methylobacterium brachythecii]